jgi:hypothetical protein
MVLIGNTDGIFSQKFAMRSACFPVLPKIQQEPADEEQLRHSPARSGEIHSCVQNLTSVIETGTHAGLIMGDQYCSFVHVFPEGAASPAKPSSARSKGSTKDGLVQQDSGTGCQSSSDNLLSGILFDCLQRPCKNAQMSSTSVVAISHLTQILLCNPYSGACAPSEGVGRA